MATDLARQRGTRKLTEAERIIADEMARDETAYDFMPTRYTVASEVGRFKNIADDTELLPEMQGIILMSRKARAFWPHDADPDDKRPLCTSFDGIEGEWRKGDVSETVRCSTCPKNRWGSAVGEDGKPRKGKACKEMRRFLILLRQFETPVVLTVPPTSIKAFDRYASGLRTQRLAYFAVETTITLEKAKSTDGYRYSVAVFRPGEALGAGELAWIVALRRQFEEALGVAPEYDEYHSEPEDADDLPF